MIVAVSAAHRAEAFAGAREAIDRIKAEAPVWKREVDTPDGETERWAGGPPHPPTAGRQPARGLLRRGTMLEGEGGLLR